ncbi:YczE/YyaS/YitT family protein [Sporohalobacter salinus]|uniref:YczE/YyaS/YitT family protein n=1 Tax=Sporohalobacter salinus TaxID=1494606 RepID=UPI00196005B4|nr:YitT family protein [Sporohalobacter salinus]MBM7623341.1 putative membrane protein YczE [Sporohalobacter salinus]
MKLLKQWTRFLIGVLVLSIGLVLTIKSNLGVRPWDVFHIGLTKYFDLTVGQANQITGLVVIIISFLLVRVKPKLGTIISIILIGSLIDLVLPLVPQPANIYWQYLYLFSGILIFGNGAGIYISAQCGAGPRDNLMIALHRKLKFKLGLVRNGIEVTILILGSILGGPVGIGTVCAALGTGPVVEFSLNVLNSSHDN